MTTQEVEPTPEEKPESEAKGLRAQNDELRRKLRESDAREAGRTITGLGLDAESGIGLVLTEQLEKGDLALDGIAQAATKYGHVAPEEVPAENPQAVAIAQSQQTLENLQGAAGSIAPPTEAERLAKAEAEKDTNASIAMKGAQINEMLRP